jgi:uroporphyrinogen-III decarboxylase
MWLSLLSLLLVRLAPLHMENYQNYEHSIHLLVNCSHLFALFLQGNMDPGVLFGSKDGIEARVLDTIRRAKSQGVRHIMNLGHGVLPGTPEENVAHYFEVARTAHERL